MEPVGQTASVDWELNASATGPLAGVRVLDLTTVVMGPSATQLLGDLGADVVKVESEAGDSMRWIGPWRHAGMGPLFLQANRNKRGVVLDLKSPEGKAHAFALAEKADVLVSNVRPQGMQRLGLDYEHVRAVNPSIIYCAAVGYGAGGPDSGKAVYDDLMQAASGIAGLFGAIDGTPRYAPVNLCDRVVGLYVSNAVISALYHRERTGQGQVTDVRDHGAVRALRSHRRRRVRPASRRDGIPTLVIPHARTISHAGWSSLFGGLYGSALARLHRTGGLSSAVGHRCAFPVTGKPHTTRRGHRTVSRRAPDLAQQSGMARSAAGHRYSGVSRQRHRGFVRGPALEGCGVLR